MGSARPDKGLYLNNSRQARRTILKSGDVRAILPRAAPRRVSLLLERVYFPLAASPPPHSSPRVHPERDNKVPPIRAALLPSARAFTRAISLVFRTRKASIRD